MPTYPSHNERRTHDGFLTVLVRSKVVLVDDEAVSADELIFRGLRRSLKQRQRKMNYFQSVFIKDIVSSVHC